MRGHPSVYYSIPLYFWSSTVAQVTQVMDAEPLVWSAQGAHSAITHVAITPTYWLPKA
jgi:hypothetical protein